MTLTEWVDAVEKLHGKGCFEVLTTGCCKAPLEVFLDTRERRLVLSCSKCEQPRMVFATSPLQTHKTE